MHSSLLYMYRLSTLISKGISINTDGLAESFFSKEFHFHNLKKNMVADPVI